MDEMLVLETARISYYMIESNDFWFFLEKIEKRARGIFRSTSAGLRHAFCIMLYAKIVHTERKFCFWKSQIAFFLVNKLPNLFFVCVWLMVRLLWENILPGGQACVVSFGEGLGCSEMSESESVWVVLSSFPGCHQLDCFWLAVFVVSGMQVMFRFSSYWMFLRIENSSGRSTKVHPDILNMFEGKKRFWEIQLRTNFTKEFWNSSKDRLPNLKFGLRN